MVPLYTDDDLLAMNLKDLRAIDYRHLMRQLSPETFDHIFRQCSALWQHSGDPKAPHARLTSGLCSNGFVNTLEVLRHTNLCSIMAQQIVGKVLDFYKKPDWVIGSDHAGATLSFEVARQLNVDHDFTEKGDGKSQVWKRFEVLPGQLVLQVEELITTSLTLKEVRKGIRAGNPLPVEFSPFVVALVHRSDELELEGTPIHFIRHFDIKTWDPTVCPLCAQGSESIPAKKNWARLTESSK